MDYQALNSVRSLIKYQEKRSNRSSLQSVCVDSSPDYKVAEINNWYRFMHYAPKNSNWRAKARMWSKKRLDNVTSCVLWKINNRNFVGFQFRDDTHFIVEFASYAILRKRIVKWHKKYMFDDFWEIINDKALPLTLNGSVEKLGY